MSATTFSNTNLFIKLSKGKWYTRQTNVIFDLSGLLYKMSSLFVSGEKYHFARSIAWRIADEAAVKTSQSFRADHVNRYCAGIPACVHVMHNDTTFIQKGGALWGHDKCVWVGEKTESIREEYTGPVVVLHHTSVYQLYLCISSYEMWKARSGYRI